MNSIELINTKRKQQITLLLYKLSLQMLLLFKLVLIFRKCVFLSPTDILLRFFFVPVFRAFIKFTCKFHDFVCFWNCLSLSQYFKKWQLKLIKTLNMSSQGYSSWKHEILYKRYNISQKYLRLPKHVIFSGLKLS